MTKEGYIRNQKIIQNRLIRKYLSQIYAALQSQISISVDMIKSHDPEYALAHITRNFGVNDQIGQVIMALYKDAAIQAAAKLRINKAAFGINIDFIQAVLDYFAQYLLEKVVIPISQTTEAMIQKVLEQAIQEGWGIEKSVKELEGSDITKWRSRMIVRTESIRAMNYSQLKAADNEHFQVQKQWIAIEDKRTRISHSHAGVDGEVRDLYQPYSNGLLFPGDPEGNAADVINCRCCEGFTFKRDLQGNLISKEQNILQSV